MIILQIDSMTLAYATSRLNGISSPANAAYSASELEFQMKNAGAKALFTVSGIIPAWSLDMSNLGAVYSSARCCVRGREEGRYPERTRLYLGNAE